MNTMKKLWLLVLVALVVACSTPPLEPVETTQQPLYSHTPGTTQLYTASNGLRFALWLPPQYDGLTPMPVLYWLHGKQVLGTPIDNVLTAQSNQVVPHVLSAINTGKMRPVMVVFPWGGYESWYVDACGVTWPWETMFGELVLDVEANTAAIGDRAHRMTGGFSMGAHGALRQAAKNPNSFVAVLAAAGPKVDHATVTWNPNELQSYADAFCSSSSNFAANSPYTWHQTNAVTIQTLPVKERLICGTADGTVNSFRAFKNKLVSQLALTPSWAEYAGISHQQAPLLQADAGASFTYLEAAMAATE